MKAFESDPTCESRFSNEHLHVSGVCFGVNRRFALDIEAENDLFALMSIF